MTSLCCCVSDQNSSPWPKIISFSKARKIVRNYCWSRAGNRRVRKKARKRTTKRHVCNSSKPHLIGRFVYEHGRWKEEAFCEVSFWKFLSDDARFLMIAAREERILARQKAEEDKKKAVAAPKGMLELFWVALYFFNYCSQLPLTLLEISLWTNLRAELARLLCSFLISLIFAFSHEDLPQ